MQLTIDEHNEGRLANLKGNVYDTQKSRTGIPDEIFIYQDLLGASRIELSSGICESKLADGLKIENAMKIVFSLRPFPERPSHRLL